MAQVTSQIFFQAVDDGESLHGVLLSSAPLVQIFNNNGCNPDWSVAANQPYIYVQAKDGMTDVSSALTDIAWTYNGQTITFDSTTGKSLTPKADTFQKTTYNGCHALKIIANLAVSDLVDTDTIGCSFKYVKNRSNIGQTLYAQVKLASVAPGTFRGVVIPATKSGNTYSEGGTTIIDKTNSDIYLFGRLYNEVGEVTPSTGFTTKWFVGINEIPAAQVITIAIGGKNYQGIHLTASDIDDYAVVECEYYVQKDGQNQKVNSATIEVDDQLDDFMLYLSTIINRDGSQLQPETTESGENGTVFLYSTDTSTVKARMGKQSDPQQTLTQFKHFYIKFYDDVSNMDGSTHCEHLAGLEDPVSTDSSKKSYGYRYSTEKGAQTYGTFTVSYNTLSTMQKRKVTGGVLASTVALSPNE